MENRIGLAPTSRADSSQADEFLRWARAADRTAPLPAEAAAAIARLEQAFRPTTKTTGNPAGLLVDFDSIIGLESQPLKTVKAGATVTATVTIRTVRLSDDGRARGIIDGSGGWAIFTTSSLAQHRLGTILTSKGRITVRGTVTMVGKVPTIDVWAARAVNV
ncbi:hypothetical protein [Streptomyces achromogenes]|uniref:hypothetical protein n=1 Tax=Streptomyces achromogenes TaxID=67255 RepID=UPI003A7FDE01